MTESSFRTETDSFGTMRIPGSAYWGIQTQRSVENFKIGTEKQPLELIRALALIKKAAAIVNVENKQLDKEIGEGIAAAADEILAGDLNNNFPLVVWQTGSGTQTNMNLNEVIARRGTELQNLLKSNEITIHPNDHCNLGQSSNDTFPSAIHIAVFHELRTKFFPAAESLIKTMRAKGEEFSDVIKIGRTHFMDATPLSVGQEFGTFGEQIHKNFLRVQHAAKALLELPQGGTAVGNGLNTKAGWDQQIVKKISSFTGYDFIAAKNKAEHMASHDALVDVSGQLRLFANSLLKVINDLRLLGSGPRCGFGELILPQNEQGSSIMPGKVNPTQIEALSQVCVQITGNDAAISFAGSQGHLQLNVYKPMIAYNLLQSIKLISQAMPSFEERCLCKIEVNREKIDHYLNRSLMLVTALVPMIGYDKAAEVAKSAYEFNTSLKEETLKRGLMTAEQYDTLVNPKKMLGPISQF